MHTEIGLQKIHRRQVRWVTRCSCKVMAIFCHATWSIANGKRAVADNRSRDSFYIQEVDLAHWTRFHSGQPFILDSPNEWTGKWVPCAALYTFFSFFCSWFASSMYEDHLKSRCGSIDATFVRDIVNPFKKISLEPFYSNQSVWMKQLLLLKLIYQRGEKKNWNEDS